MQSRRQENGLRDPGNLGESKIVAEVVEDYKEKVKKLFMPQWHQMRRNQIKLNKSLFLWPNKCLYAYLMYFC